MRIPVMSWNDIAVRKKLYAFFLWLCHNKWLIFDEK